MLTTDKIDALLAERLVARERKDFVESDRLREFLRNNGILVIDTDIGQLANAGTEFEQIKNRSSESALSNRVSFLEHSVKVLLRREQYYQERILELGRENLKLKYGGIESDASPTPASTNA